uniref:Alpha-amylase n=1 Tax=Euplotes harpa TaxID=151035 RepID=A0A7S3JJD1_9SPIT|mmetsp:Transcript_43354/g.50957  ORF Transcript_43354/g.50957 Transcript_43354/m.50957 type:complete len:603 (+) Transcript_43354:85-1893(+)
MGCKDGQQTSYPDSWAHRSFQTPLKGDPLYQDSYESLGRIACYPDVVYSVDRSSATVEVKCRTQETVTSVVYSYNGAAFVSDNTFKADKSFSDVLHIVVSDGGDFKVTLEDVDFMWNAPKINQSSVYENGQKGAIVELFGWPYEDVEQECAHIAKAGWMGVKVFPPSEQVMSDEWPQQGELNPWWFIYQVVSYKLSGRMGTRDQLRKMINTCRAAGVRVYADAVINHMTGGGNDRWDYHIAGNCATWGPKSSSGGSPFYTHDFMDHNSNQTHDRPGLEYPSVPYNPTDFHCERSLNSWTDPFILNHGWLVGLADLNTEKDYVRERIASYLVDLISIGFSGFRIDAAKHIYPASLAAILRKFKDKLGGGELPDDFITFLEVIIGGEASLLMCQDNDYNFGKNFEDKMRAAGLSDNDIMKVKIWSSDYPKEFPICGYWAIPAERLAVENDCHDDQNPGSSSRDMGDKGSVLIKDRDVNKHRAFEVQLFTRTEANWKIKLVLSSYSFMNNGAAGFPDGRSDCSKCTGTHCGDCSKSMKYSKAYDADACGYTCSVNGQWMEGVYTRVHRDQDIINAMRQWQGLGQANSLSEIGLPEHCANIKEATS